jgi:Domain of unknown function (DUF4926)
MDPTKPAKNEELSRLDTVQLLVDLPALQLVRGQVGTIAHEIDSEIVIVEFTDKRGRLHAHASCHKDKLALVQRYAGGD